MPALGALVVGIDDYRPSERFPSIRPLRFAMEDANAIEEYLKACWPEESGRHIERIAADRATAPVLREAVNNLARHGKYELLIIYLSGHGNVGTPATGFLLQPTLDSPSETILSPQELDRALTSIAAERAVLVLDCCFAEAIVKEMDFFRALGDSEARLFIASSRVDQRTWEEERARHGVFTAFLLDLLRLGTARQLPGKRDRVDVDAELFPFLCKQVPLYVLEHKNAHQEPVKGGLARAPVNLPLHQAVRSLHARTALGTALRRVRQILVATVTAVLSVIALAYALLYYAEADSTGEIVLRHGTRWLDPVLRYVEPVRLRTGIQVASLSPEAADRYPVQSGSLVGIWTHHTRGGYRAWYEGLSATLNAESRRHYDMLVGRSGPGSIQWPPVLEAHPEDAAFAAWTVLVEPSPTTIHWAFSAIPGTERLQTVAAPFDPNHFDFGILDLTVAQIETYLQALQRLAIIDPDRALQSYLGFLMAMQEWIYQRRGERFDLARARVVEGVSGALPILAASRLDRGSPALPTEISTALVHLMANGYFDIAAAALARVAGDPVRDAAVRSAALARLRGGSIGVEQLLAIRALAYAADSSQNSLQSVEHVVVFFHNTGNPENTNLTKFLIDVADHQGLPETVRRDLLRKAREAETREFQFLDQERARILAHGLAQLTPAEREIAYRLIDRLATNITGRSETLAEIYGAAARQELDRPPMLSAVIQQCISLADNSFRPNQDPDHQIIVGGVQWAAALAEFGKTRPLPDKAYDLLRKFALHPALQPFRQDFDLALARQASFKGDRCAKNLCLEDLQRLGNESGERALLTRVLAWHLAATSSRTTFLATLDDVRRDRAVETEPELRIALGELIVNAQEGRIHEKLPNRMP